MKQAVRGSKPGPPPLPQTTQRDSGTRLVGPEPTPSTHFAPLPLGSDAFMPPLAPADGGGETSPRRWGAPLAAGLTVVAFGAVIALTLSLRREPEGIAPEPPTASRGAAPATAGGPSPVSAAPSIASAGPVTATRALATDLRPATGATLAPSLPAPAVAPAAAEPEPERVADDSRRRSRRSRNKDREPALDKPSRAQVIAAMTRVQRHVKACLPGGRGSLTADVKILGKTGRVTTAQISGPKGEVGSCVARAVRKAKFPKFSTESLSIRYPMAF